MNTFRPFISTDDFYNLTQCQEDEYIDSIREDMMLNDLDDHAWKEALATVKDDLNYSLCQITGWWNNQLREGHPGMAYLLSTNDIQQLNFQTLDQNPSVAHIEVIILLDEYANEWRVRSDHTCPVGFRSTPTGAVHVGGGPGGWNQPDRFFGENNQSSSSSELYAGQCIPVHIQ